MSESIAVWRDVYGSFELVGTISVHDAHTAFSYDASYSGPPISFRLPLQTEPFSEHDTETFFSALVPEGQTRIDFLDALRADRSEYSPLLERLNDESSGGLVFTTDGRQPGSTQSYVPLPSDFFERLSAEPLAASEDAVGEARLSLAGTMAKVGLYRDPQSERWFLPKGAAPSTHIVKAGDSNRFPLEVLNEALCLELAKLCELPVSEYDLIPTQSGPLLAIRRYDRPFAENPMLSDGLPVPLRLHQEDFCQLTGTKLKYEPTGANYLSFAVSHASSACDNSFGEAMIVLYYVFFDYLVGNCDNHLKNLSVLYSPDWRHRQMAPLYDVVDTTVYERLTDVMGISLAPSRSIFDVTRESLSTTIRDSGMPERLALREFDLLAEEVLGKFEQARDSIVGMGFPQAAELFDAMLPGMEQRARFDFSPKDSVFIG